MKRTISAIAAALFLTATAWAAPPGATKEPDAKTDEQAIRDILAQYFKAMRDRDVPTIQRMLAPSVTVIEAGQSGRVHLVDPNDTKKLLPPEGNKDWEKINLADVIVQISPTHPSVAMVSFVLAKTLSDSEVKGMQAGLANPPEWFKASKEQMKQIEDMLKNKRQDMSMFAMVTKQRGGWKIVSMTFPK